VRWRTWAAICRSSANGLGRTTSSQVALGSTVGPVYPGAGAPAPGTPARRHHLRASPQPVVAERRPGGWWAVEVELAGHLGVSPAARAKRLERPPLFSRRGFRRQWAGCMGLASRSRVPATRAPGRGQQAMQRGLAVPPAEARRPRGRQARARATGYLPVATGGYGSQIGGWAAAAPGAAPTATL
jgi:hypothetical protein